MKSYCISGMKAREVLNNKGCPVLEVDVLSEDGRLGRASASFGISAGAHEVAVVRDGGPRYGGMGVLGPIRLVEERILPALRGLDCRDQRAVDRTLLELDGTPDKSALGGNTICSVSLAVARLGALHREVPLYQYLGGALCDTLPLPLFNMINGGPYSAAPTDFQEFHAAPAGAKSFAEAMRMGVEVLQRLPEVIRKRHGAAAYRPGHLGGIGAPSAAPREVLATLWAAVEEAGYADRFVLSLDCATSHLFDPESGRYNLNFGRFDTTEMIDYFTELVRDFPIFMLEDPLHEDDFEGFARLNTAVPTLICGDDLFVTSVRRLAVGAALNAAGAMIFKPNMIGSVSEALDAARYAVAHGMEVIPSQRAATSPDDPTAELGLAVGARLMKVGAPQTGERTQQQNNLIRIEESMGAAARLISGEEVRRWLVR